MNFRWCLYGYLLSILESIIQRTKDLYIKITLQVCDKKFIHAKLPTKKIQFIFMYEKEAEEWR